MAKKMRKMNQNQANADVVTALLEGLVVRPVAWLLCRFTGRFCDWKPMGEGDD